jgi:hypothetical protein
MIEISTNVLFQSEKDAVPHQRLRSSAVCVPAVDTIETTALTASLCSTDVPLTRPVLNPILRTDKSRLLPRCERRGALPCNFVRE